MFNTFIPVVHVHTLRPFLGIHHVGQLLTCFVHTSENLMLHFLVTIRTPPLMIKLGRSRTRLRCPPRQYYKEDSFRSNICPRPTVGIPLITLRRIDNDWNHDIPLAMNNENALAAVIAARYNPFTVFGVRFSTISTFWGY